MQLRHAHSYKSAMVSKLFVLLLILFTASISKSQQLPILNVGGADEWFPVSYINENTKKTEGIGYDLAQLVAKELKTSIEISPNLPWKRLLLRLESGKLDMCIGIYWNKERSKIFHYTESFLTNEPRVFVKKGREFKFEKIEDLKGLIGGAPLGASFGEEFDSFAEEFLTLQRVTGYIQMSQMLLLDRNDYYIADYIDGMSYLEQKKLKSRVVALSKPIAKIEVYFAISKKSPFAKVLPQITNIIKKAKKDGTIDKMISKYVTLPVNTQ